MTRLRVTEAMYRHLDSLQDSKTAAKGGVMLVPGIKSIADWEAEAIPAQQELMEWSMTTHGGARVREPVPEPMTARQEREYQHQLRSSRYLGLTDEERAARAAKAIGLIR